MTLNTLPTMPQLWDTIYGYLEFFVFVERRMILDVPQEICVIFGDIEQAWRRQWEDEEMEEWAAMVEEWEDEMEELNPRWMARAWTTLGCRMPGGRICNGAKGQYIPKLH